MINRRIDGRYDDIWGPAVLCLLLVVALIVSINVSLNKHIDTNFFNLGQLLSSI